MSRFECSSARLKSLLSVLSVLLLFFVIGSDSISCYECDLIETSSPISCPGRRVVNYGANSDACIIYRLSSGRIVYQGAVNTRRAENLCSKTPSFLKKVIRDNFDTDGNAMCCRSNGCNRDIPDDFVALDDGDDLFVESVLVTGSAPSKLKDGDDDKNDKKDDNNNATKSKLGPSVVALTTMATLILAKLAL